MEKRGAIIGKEQINVPLSPAYRAGDYIFVSGQVPTEAGKVVGSSVEEQTKVVLGKIDSILKNAGSSLEEVIKVTVFMTDIRNFDKMNKVYKQFFKGDFPARSCVEAKLAVDVELEIEAIAYSPL